MHFIDYYYLRVILFLFSCCYGISDYYYCDNSVTTFSSCPRNPSISVSDSSDLSGPIDSMNVFVAEKLLELAEEVKLYNFFLIYQVIKQVYTVSNSNV